MNIYEIITKTKRKKELSENEINWLITEYVKGNIPDYQISAWLMAVYFNSLTDKETAILTDVMCNSGDKFDLSCINGITVDKHSTGGVGDKTSLIIAPIVASCEVFVPKMSGRGLGHTGGTIDKLESIEGFNTEIPFDKFIDIVNKAGLSIISQSGKIVPADKKLYTLRNATTTVDSIPLICSSIMSKKLAMGANCILLDVKVGSGAFMKEESSAMQLANLMVNTAKYSGKKCMAMLTNMDMPLGNAIGNSLEVIEAIDILKGNKKCKLYELCIEMASNMLYLSGKGNMDQCRNMSKEAIESGKALERLRLMIDLQGGNPQIVENYSLFPQAIYSYSVKATETGYIRSIDSEKIGLVALQLGAGRLQKDSTIDLSAGIIIHANIGDYVQKGDIIMTLYSSSVSDFSKISLDARNSYNYSDNKLSEKPLILKLIF